ncbi:MAG: hypothetical protein Q4Q58_02240 [Thermoplasmata archaeon]|nr:hypothetical protein [Thermoplasmata archaeon]
MSDPAFEAITRAKNQASSGNPKGAVDTLEAYLATDPHNTKPRMVLANIAANEYGDTEYGLMQLDIIIDLEPENTDAMMAKISLLCNDKRRNRETDEVFQKLLEIAPKAEFYNEYARFCRNQLIDFKKSREYYEKALELDPDNYDYHLNYTVLLLNDAKDYVKAKEELEILMDMRPGEPKIKSNYDRLMREKFDKDGNPKKTFMDKLRRK